MPSLHVVVTEEHHKRAQAAFDNLEPPYLNRCDTCDIAQALHDLGYPKAWVGIEQVSLTGGPDPDADLPEEAQDFVEKVDDRQPVSLPFEFDLPLREAPDA